MAAAMATIAPGFAALNAWLRMAERSFPSSIEPAVDALLSVNPEFSISCSPS